jgi:predicted RNase H-like HicB family nuclease
LFPAYPLERELEPMGGALLGLKVAVLHPFGRASGNAIPICPQRAPVWTGRLECEHLPLLAHESWSFRRWWSILGMESQREVEFGFEPQAQGGYHVYAPELPGLHTQGEDLEEATENAREALALYVEGLREDGRSLEMGIVRRTLPLPA